PTFTPAFRIASTNILRSRSIVHASRSGTRRVAGLAGSAKRKDSYCGLAPRVLLTLGENMRTSRGSCEVTTDEAGTETIQKDGTSPRDTCPYRREKNGQGDNYRL